MRHFLSFSRSGSERSDKADAHTGTHKTRLKHIEIERERRRTERRSRKKIEKGSKQHKKAIRQRKQASFMYMYFSENMQKLSLLIRLSLE